jgi:hypothetical protein
METKLRKDKVKGCGKYIYSEGNYHQTCDGYTLCDSTYRLCEECKNKPIVRISNN